MSYLYSIEKMIHLIKEGTTAKKNGQSVIFNRKLEVTSNNVKCYLIIEGETEERVYSFKTLYEKEMFDYDDGIFQKGDNINPSIIIKEHDKHDNANLTSQVAALFNDEDTNNKKAGSDVTEDNRLNFLDINDYSDLKLFLFKYDTSERCEFYHYTAVQNAVSILENGYIMSRASCPGLIRYDNMEKNMTTPDVINSNYSSKVNKYARFYFNVRNAATYNMRQNFKRTNTFGVIIAIEYSSIWSNSKVFIIPKSAHYATDYDLSWKGNTIVDISVKSNLKRIDCDSFDFKSTFKEYNPNEINDYQMAEILFYDRVPIKCISHIYLGSELEKNTFLNALSPMVRKNIEQKCVVDEYMHWRK